MDAHEHDPPEEAILREYRLDLAAVRERLAAKSGKEYWRGLEELADDPHFEEMLHREFPRYASEWDNTVDRRDFLKLVAASLALAGLSGCARKPEETIVPYVKAPVGLTLGKPLYFATAMPLGADAIGLLVESHEGRPTKIEGNPDHPASLGATDAIAQASILGLYDPDRSQTLTYLGDIRAWSAFLAEARGMTEALEANKGAGFRILTGSVVSPTLAAQIKALLAAFPEANWHQWEPAGSDGAREGGKLTFGRYVNTVYGIEKADVILSLDSDFLASGPGHVRYAREFSRRRRVAEGSPEMNRLYVVEPTPSVTGAAADHRLPLRPGEVETFARALAARLGLGGATAVSGEHARWFEAVAKDLQKHRGACLVVAGEQQPATIHALAHAINAVLGNVGSTLHYTEPVEAEPTNHLESLRELVADMGTGKVDVLLILGGNPVYDAPHDFQFAERLKNVRVRIHLSPYYDETSEYCQWHVPESHYLESWGDARCYDGTASIVQPLIAPVYRTKTTHEVLAAFSGQPDRSGYDIVRDHWKSQRPGADFEALWKRWLHDGVVAGTAFPPASVSVKFSPAGLPVEKPAGTGLDVVFRADSAVFDGRFANNGWLQELPRPVTKLTWDNAAIMSPKTAEQLKLSYTVGMSGGEHGRVFADVVDIEAGGSKVTAATWVVPGQVDGVITLTLGYGRRRAGQTGNNKGYNACAVRTSSTLWAGGR